METTKTPVPDTILAGLRDGASLAAIAADLGLDLVTDQIGREMIAAPGYVVCCDGADVHLDTADSAKEAAAEYVDGGDWGDDRSKSSWISVQTWRQGWSVTASNECSYCTQQATAHDSDGDRACAQHASTPREGVRLQPIGEIEVERSETKSEDVLIEIPPVEPDCIDGHEHDWLSPEWLGGLQENPGVWGHGGGVIMTRVCLHCGCGRTTDTWAQDPSSGTRQGLTSVEYDPERFVDEIAEREEQA